MAERQADAAGTGDTHSQDGLGRDAAHGPDEGASGGSYGRATGRGAADDLLGIDAAGRDAAARDTSARDAAAGSTGPGRAPGTATSGAGRETPDGGASDRDPAGVDLDADVDVGRRDPTNS